MQSAAGVNDKARHCRAFSFPAASYRCLSGDLSDSGAVRSWEQGDKKPSGPSLKLLNLIDRKGLDAVL